MYVRFKRDIIETLSPYAPEKKRHAKYKTEIADTVDNESLVTGQNILRVFTVKTNKQVRTEAHTFPADKHDDGAIAEDKHQHAA